MEQTGSVLPQIIVRLLGKEVYKGLSNILYKFTNSNNSRIRVDKIMSFPEEKNIFAGKTDIHTDAKKCIRAHCALAHVD